MAVIEPEWLMTELRYLRGLLKRVVRRESQTEEGIGFGVYEAVGKEQRSEGLSSRFMDMARVFIWMRSWCVF